jgi:hypothetical protein
MVPEVRRRARETIFPSRWLTCPLSEAEMEIDTDKIDDAVLALLHLTRCDERYGVTAWKSHDWDALNRLHEKGLIGNPVSKNKSVELTEEGRAKAEELFGKLFGKSQ